MNVDDIRNAVFDKTMRGYRMEQVDDFLAQVAAEFERMEQEKEDIEKKLYILAEKVDQYRNDEETLKTALLNAQRMGESVIYEARQKAETIVYEANSKASQLKDEAAQTVADAELELARLKAEVSSFKGGVLDLYRQHIELLSAIPEEHHIRREDAAQEGGQPQDEQVVDAAAETELPVLDTDVEADTFFEEEDSYEISDAENPQQDENEEVPGQEDEFEDLLQSEEDVEEYEEPQPRRKKGKRAHQQDDVSFGSYQDITFH